MLSALLLLALTLQDAPDAQLADLKRAWQESCADRAYGTFDDVCTQMSDQIRAYEREQAKAGRVRARSPAKPVAPPTASPPMATPPGSIAAR